MGPNTRLISKVPIAQQRLSGMAAQLELVGAIRPSHPPIASESSAFRVIRGDLGSVAHFTCIEHFVEQTKTPPRTPKAARKHAPIISRGRLLRTSNDYSGFLISLRFQPQCHLEV